MRFLYLAIHYPKPEHTTDLLVAMQGLGTAMRSADGLIEATAWLDQDSERIVATSVWESEASFQQAIPIIGGSVRDVPFDVWEERPRELLRLVELPPPAAA